MDLVDDKDAEIARLRARLAELGHPDPPVRSSSPSGSENEQDEDEDEGTAILGANVVLEFGRDSPYTHRQVERYKETLDGLQDFFEGISSACDGYARAAAQMGEAEEQLAAALSSSSSARALFSNSFRGLGDPSAMLADFRDLLRRLRSGRDILVSTLHTTFLQPLTHFSRSEIPAVGPMLKRVEKLRQDYDGLLGKALLKDPAPGVLAELSAAEAEFHLARFDVVRSLNQLDAMKKFKVCESLNAALYAYLGYFHGSHAVVDSLEPAILSRQKALMKCHEVYASEQRLWESKRSQLEAELAGGVTVPPGGRGSTNPPPRSAVLTVQIKPEEKQKAPLRDVQHEEDEGVLKQGYLFDDRGRPGFFRSRRSYWYRLYGSKLYREEGEGEESDPVLVCDLRAHTVRPSADDLPFSFEIVPAPPADETSTVWLQTARQDDLEAWMGALRRCGHLRSSSFTTSSSSSSSARSGGAPAPAAALAVADAGASAAGPTPPMSDREATLSGQGAGRSPVRRGSSSNGNSPPSIQRLVGSSCADCGAILCDWVSVAFGSPLCDSCATAHRKLGLFVGCLRSLGLDEFPPWLIALLDSLTPEIANGVWEAVLPEGWEKPRPDSPAEVREQWISAKYQWNGFAEPDMSTPGELGEMLCSAARMGDVGQVLWCLAHGAPVNHRSEGREGQEEPEGQEGGLTPLMLAVQERAVDCAELLLQNGADAALATAGGVTATQLAEGAEMLEQQLAAHQA